MVFAPSFVPLLVSFFIPFLGPFLVSSVVPFFDPPRLSFRPSARFSVSFLAPPFAQSLVSFFRLVVSGIGLRVAPFCSALWERAGVCVFFRVLVSWRQWGGRAVSLMGSVLRMSCRGRLCVMRAMPCGWAWGVLFGEALSGAWWRLWDMGITRRMAGRWGREG